MVSAKTVAVFLDRDGVINVNRDDYVKSWTEFRFLPGALDALSRLAASPAKVIIITNQSAVGRGLLSLDELKQIHATMTEVIQTRGGRIDHVFYCPHHPAEGCDCRKPKPGLLIQAADRLNLDLGRSYFVGDSISDIEAGLTAGCQPLLVLTGRGMHAKRALTDHLSSQCEVLPDLPVAVDWILQRIVSLKSIDNDQ